MGDFASIVANYIKLDRNALGGILQDNLSSRKILQDIGYLAWSCMITIFLQDLVR